VPVADELWETLISCIEDGKVVPVIGPELLIVPDGDRQVPLYRLIAERLAAKFDLHPQWRQGAELNAAVCAYLDEKPRARVEDLYSPIHSILKSLALAPPEPLLKLAGISGFNLFVTATFDSLLVDALNRVRFASQPRVQPLAYAPNLGSGVPRDLPESPSADPVVFNLFGMASAFPDFAIHDEDYLEFVHKIETGPGKPERLLQRLKTLYLLFIGCEFADWLNRFVIRLANTERLRNNRERTEYIVSLEATQDRDLTMFLTRFSIPTRVLDLTGTQFVDELFTRWNQRHPAPARATAADPTSTAVVQPSARGAIFISYSRQDYRAAEALRTAVASIAGDDICWFDKSTLQPGDRWDDEILTSINSSIQMFLPVISRNTEARSEGVVFKEWRRAIEAQQRKGFLKRRFIVPVVVDPDFQGEIGAYKNIPKEFFELDFGRAPEGNPDESLSRMLKEEIRLMRPGNR
jgi:hypothetical protein